MPLVHALESDGTATFYFTEGPTEASPPPGYEHFFGEGPHKCYQIEEAFESLTPLVHHPTCSSLEASISQLTDLPGKKAIVKAIELLNHILETEGPFDAVVGFSEGSGLAATFLADHLIKSRAAGKKSMLKLGIFWGGMPPFSGDGKRCYLPHSEGQIFDIRTIHVIGAMDPFLEAGMLLYEMCDPKGATLFDHGKGHQLVWEPKIVKSLAEVVREEIAVISSEMRDDELCLTVE